MSPRMSNPTLIVPGSLKALLELRDAIFATGVSKDTLVLLHLRVSQLNGREIKVPTTGENVTDEDRRQAQVQDWRDSTVFTPAECAALALAESTTRMGRGGDPVSDGVWAEASKYYNEQELGALVLQIGLINLWNRVNIVTKQDGLDWGIPDEEWVPMTTRLQNA